MIHLTYQSKSEFHKMKREEFIKELEIMKNINWHN